MTIADAALLLAIAAVVAVAVCFPVTLAAARRRVDVRGAVPPRLLVLALLCGVVLVAAIATIVAVVVLT